MRPALPLVGGAALVLGCASACGVTRDGTLRPSVNDCVPAIAVAQQLLGSGAQLRHLRRLSLPEAQTLLRDLPAPELTAPPSSAAGARPTASPAASGSEQRRGPRPCVFTFGGQFTAASLQSAARTAGTTVTGAQSGSVAVVVTTTRHPRVLRLALANHDPLR